MSSFHPADSSLANFNDTISTISTTPLRTRLSIYISCSHDITAHTLCRFHGEHQVNTKSFRVLFTCRVRCHVHVVAVWGVVNFFLLFIIKRILGIKRIFPCSFRNKRMRLLTRVYGIPYSTYYPPTPVFGQKLCGRVFTYIISAHPLPRDCSLYRNDNDNM